MVAQLTKDIGEKSDFRDLKGSIPFMAELVKHIDTYWNGLYDGSSYMVEQQVVVWSISIRCDSDIKGRHVLFVENMIW